MSKHGRRDNDPGKTMKDTITASSKDAGRSGKGRKAGGETGSRPAGGIKGDGKRNTHIGDKKAVPAA